MFHFLSQKRLQSRGFSSGQKRRKLSDTAWTEMLRSGWQVSGVLFVVFAVLVSAWIIVSASASSIFGGNSLRTVVVVTVISATLVVHWHVSLPQTFRQNSRIALILLVILIQLMLVKLSEYVATTFAPEGGFRFLVEPYLFAPIVVSLLVGRRHGTFAVVYSSLLGGMTIEKTEAFHFILFSMICGFVAIYLTNNVRRRSRLVMAGAYSGVACVLLATTLGQIQWPSWSADFVDWEMVTRQVLSAVLVSSLTAVLVSGLLPLIEATFRITTDVSWIELADLNHPLLRQMTIEAPGTYHHSLVVATLAETAAEAIGASAVMCRVCSYFHDIGKMKKPSYFIENIGDGHNPHDDLTPNMSALVVMAHVKDGVDLAIKHKMNEEIVNVIMEHHGTSLIRFFHHRALKQREEVERQVAEGRAHEDDIPDVKEESFRYPGPRPRTRESAIISLADSVESASRSLQKPTPKKIDELIDDIFKDRLNDGQLDDAALTLGDPAFDDAQPHRVSQARRG
jgi:putative nucleotidyltransferase with HDIG domain